MAMIIDGNSDSSTENSKLRNIGAIPRIIIALLLVLLAIFLYLYVAYIIEGNYEKTMKDPTTTFVNNFFLEGYEEGKDACSSIHLTSSYDSCVSYYDEEFYPTYKDINFDYTINILYGRRQTRASIILKNATSSTNNFNYTEIQIQIVAVYKDDSHYSFGESMDSLVKVDDKVTFDVLFSTINFIG